jgi:hypothetical protein
MLELMQSKQENTWAHYRRLQCLGKRCKVGLNKFQGSGYITIMNDGYDGDLYDNDNNNITGPCN